MIYLDNNATTKPNNNMLHSVCNAVGSYYGNPSSLHECGQQSRNLIEEARQQVASYIGAKPTEIIFTSGGTEANNIALADVESRYIKIISAVEHSSVSKRPRVLKVGVDSEGLLDLDKLERMVKNFTSPCLVSVMMANNETGVILDPYGELLKLKNRYGFLLHVDAVQGFGKLPIDLSSQGIDMLTISAHKAHGLKGVGALYVKSDLQNISYPNPLLVGGSHESGYRPGTENLLGVLSLGYMAHKLHTDDNYGGLCADIKRKRDWFEEQLSDVSEVNGSRQHRIHNTSNLYFPDIDDLTLFLEVLSQNGVCASGQSACSSGLAEPSRVLTEMYGASSPKLHGSVRFSLSVETTDEELQEAVDIIRDVVDTCKQVKEIVEND